MLISIPVFTAVYVRRSASEHTFRFSHLSRSSYLHPVPTTLAVSDLRQYSVDLHNIPSGGGVSDVPLLAFVTGDLDAPGGCTMVSITLRNWANRSRRVVSYSDRFGPCPPPTASRQFPDGRCTETLHGYIMIPFFASLCSYAQQGRRYTRWGFSGQRFIPSGHSVLPPILDPRGRSIAPYITMCRRALRRVTHTNAWLVGRYSYLESCPVPRGCRHDQPDVLSE